MVDIAQLPRAPAVDTTAVVVDAELLAHWGSRIGR
jgi:hypothetical protein